MNSDLQRVLVVLVIGAVAFISILIAGIIITACFYFPRKCDKCGKYWAVNVKRTDQANYYTAGGFVVTTKVFYHRKCLNCGHKTEEKLAYKIEDLKRG